MAFIKIMKNTEYVDLLSFHEMLASKLSILYAGIHLNIN